MLAAAAAALPSAAQPAGDPAAPPFENRLTGDLGVGVYWRSELVRDTGSSTSVLPYVYADWGRAFGRLDTLGVKLVPVGWGHLELVGRISLEGWDADAPALSGLGDRSNPVPLGIGTYQRTPVGAFFLYAMYDLTSGGQYLEATWATRFDTGRVAVYPLLGVEYRSSRYVQHLYGIDAAQSAASGYPVYAPGGSTAPLVGLAASVRIAGPWTVQAQWRRRWFDGAVADSPIVVRSTQDSAHVALAYEFK